jgi:beta-lactamase regulating signal transducer with metallopeptidase domain
MSRFAVWLDFFAAWIDASIGLVLVVKWTVVLALAWLAHGILAGWNPRWRVMLWRSAVVGLALVTVLSTTVPPIVTFQSGPRDQPSVDLARTAPASRAIKGRGAPAIIPQRETPVPIRPVAAVSSSVVPIRHDEPRPAPAAAEAQGSPWGACIGPWLWPAWLAGVLVLTARLTVGSRSLARVIKRSSSPPDAVIRECLMIAERLGCRGPVRVRRTSDVAIPCLAGLWRSVLLLPERECEEVRPDDLRAILAHELAHARNHDLAWNREVHFASILLWFHPLASRIRAVHAAACGAVCDAVAADLLGDVASYGRTLARLAVRAARPSSAHGLAMARTSDVRRRLDALNRQVFRASLSWRRVMPALFVGSVPLVLIGGFAFTRAEQAASTSQANDAAKPVDPMMAEKMTLRAVLAETNEPIEGVSIAYRRNRPDGTNEKGTVTTGKDGTATIEYPASFKTGYFEITASKPKLAPLYLLWDDKRHPLELPSNKLLRFEPGTLIGGIVQDESGHPIDGATVELNGLPTEYEGSNNSFTLSKTKTNAQGRWRLDVAPKILSGVWVSAKDPRYQQGAGEIIASLGRDSVMILKKCLTVTGRVVDSAGRPVKGAGAFIGHDSFDPFTVTGTTNERGEFILENCAAGPKIVTVQADDFAPHVRDVRVDERTAPLEIQLMEPGSVLRCKVVDIEGKPVAGAFFGADSWRGRRSIHFTAKTDKDGRIEWRSAPNDVVLYHTGKIGYMSSRHVPLTATGREQVITIYPELVITGRVTDVHTGQPLPRFRLTRGQKYEGQTETDWAVNEAVDITGDRYTMRFSEPWGLFFARVEVPGYQPAESRAFKSTERNPTFDFALVRGEEPLSGIVLLPDGKPAVGAEIVVDTRELGYLMQAGKFDRRANVPTVTAGPAAGSC